MKIAQRTYAFAAPETVLVRAFGSSKYCATPQTLIDEVKPEWRELFIGRAELVFHFSIFSDPEDRIGTPFTPNQDRKITTLKLDYLKFATVQRNKPQSFQRFALSALRVIHARGGKTVGTLPVWRELMPPRDLDHDRPARICEPRSTPNEVVRGETVAVPHGRRQARVSFSLPDDIDSV